MSPRSLEAIAADIGVVDIFVFHVLSEDRMVNLDGWGRGSGWAGNVCLSPETENFLAKALEGGVARIGPGSPTRIFGPYWAEEAIAVRTDGHVVALGGSGIVGLEDDLVQQAADRAVDAVQDVMASQRLAAKLEIAQAELSVATIQAETVDEALGLLAQRAATALSCEFGAALLLGEQLYFAMADEGWRPPATRDEVVTALMPLVAVATDGLLIEQDLRESPYAVSPVSYAEGLVSRCTAPFELGESAGLIVVAHSGSAPRGFTDLCQTVASTMAASSRLPLSRFF